MHNDASHCDIAWAAALSSYAHSVCHGEVGAAVGHDNGWFDGREFHPDRSPEPLSAETRLLWIDDPEVWRKLA